MQLERSSFRAMLLRDSKSSVTRYPVILQDVLHRVSAPSQLAEGRPRFSLVWKLAFLPRSSDAVACLSRPEWGSSTAFGSAARLEAMQRSVAARKRKASALH